MKKNVFMLVVLLLMAVVFSGCGKTEMTEPVETESEEAVPAETEVVEETEEESQEETEAAEVTDEDFQIFDLGDGTCEIGGCFVDSSVIEIPATINDLVVVGIGGSGLSGVQAEQVILPDTVTYIGEAAFNNCENLKSVDLGLGLKSIAMRAFYNCPELENLAFPEGMEEVGMAIFSFSEKIGDVYIPESVTVCGAIANAELCPNLVVVTPAGSAAEEMAIAAGLPVRNS